MTHGSLFSGMGGFDLAAEWMGWENIFHCEWNPFGQKILKYYWPQAINYEDITKTDFSIHRGTIDILTGGFPCQPYSLAGQRKGKEDERHLWPHMLRAIREIKPRWVVGENVLGLVGWNGGLVFEEVQADLEAEGYEVQPYILPAASVNAPHRRDRVWFVAYRNVGPTGSSGTSGKTKGDRSKNNDEPGSRGFEREQHFGCSQLLQSTSNAANSGIKSLRERPKCSDESHITTNSYSESRQSEVESRGEKHIKKREKVRSDTTPTIERRNASNATIEGLEITGQAGVRELSKKDSTGLDNRLEQFSANVANPEMSNKQWNRLCKVCRQRPAGRCNCQRNYWDNFPTQSPICDGNDGFSARLDGITFSKWRNESIKAGGNAIVPQVALQIFKAIQEYENLNK